VVNFALRSFCFVVAADHKSEAIIGEVLAEAFKTGLAKREDLFITTKV
jgi:aldehyde reductase